MSYKKKMIILPATKALVLNANKNYFLDFFNQKQILCH